MNINPVVFQDGESTFQELGHKYIKHDKGFFILAPSGIGKTYFCQHQTAFAILIVCTAIHP